MKIRMSVSPLALSLLAAIAWTAPSAAETVTVTGISVSGADGFSIEVPTVEAVDSNLDEAEIRALFTTELAQSAPTLASLEASAIRIPEIIVTYDVPLADGTKSSARLVYRGLELMNVTDGVAQSARVGATEITSGDADAVVTLGSISTGLFDLGAILAFYGLVPGQPGAEMRPVYQSFALEGGSITAETGSCTIGPVTADFFNARPIKGSFADMMRLTSELEAAEKSGTPPSPEKIAEFIAFYADMLTAFESSPTDFDGFSCDFADPSGKRFALNAGSAQVGGFEPGIYPSFVLDDFTVEADDGSFSFENFTWKRMDLNGPIQNLLEVGAAIDEKWLEENWRLLLPAIEGLSLSGLAFDVPDPANQGGRIVAGIGSFDVSLGDYVNGIPATIASSASKVEFAVPEGSDGATLRAMGVERLSLGYNLAARWNESDKTIAIDELSFAGNDLGSIRISGTLANAGPELFSQRNDVALAAAMALTATELTIELENAGALSLIIAAAAAQEKQAPEAFQIAMAGMAQALPLAILGGTPEAIELSNALGAFMTGTPNLTLTLTSTDPKGIGLAELLAAEDDPAALKGKVAIAASVSGEPVPFVWPEIAPPSEPQAEAEGPRAGRAPTTVD